MNESITSIALASARSNVEALKKQLEQAQLVEAQEEEREKRELESSQSRIITPNEEEAKRLLVPERYRAFVFPKRDKNNRQEWQHSVLCAKEFREALIPHLPFLTDVSRECTARCSRNGFNATHFLTQAVYNGLKDMRNMEFYTTEEICYLIGKQ